MMRKVRWLNVCDYLVPISQKTGQIFTLSNSASITLERTWHDQGGDHELNLHAKFDSTSMNGIMLMATLIKGNRPAGCAADEFKLYLVNEADWTETLLDTFPATQASHGVFTADVTQADLNPHELSGREVFAVECIATRRRKKFRKKVWFNHLGCYDHLIRLRHAVEHLEATKVDE